MKLRMKTWTKLGLSTALATGAIAACSQAPSDEGVSADAPPLASSDAGEAGEGEGEGEGEGGEAGHSMDTLPVEKRVAFKYRVQHRIEINVSNRCRTLVKEVQ